MPERAHVTSLEAIESFRSSLVVFLSRARPVIEDVSDEVARMRNWLQTDRRLYWENQLRRRSKALEQAQQALFSAEMAHLRTAITTEQMAVNRAKRAVAEAEAKLRSVKHWTREFDTQVEPLARQLDQLRGFLACDMPQGVAWLGQVVKSLDAYMDVAPPPALDEPAGASTSDSASESSASATAEGGSASTRENP